MDLYPPTGNKNYINYMIIYPFYAICSETFYWYVSQISFL